MSSTRETTSTEIDMVRGVQEEDTERPFDYLAHPQSKDFGLIFLVPPTANPQDMHS